MGETGVETLLNAAFMVWFILHPIAAVHNLINGIDKGYGHSYGWTGYLFAACYLLAMFTVMYLTARGRRRELARYLGRYWLVSLVICVLTLIVQDASDFVGIAVLSIMITPILHLMPLLELLSVSGQVFRFSTILSLLCWVLCLWVQRKK